MTLISSWDDLPFWDSGEWQVIEEKLDELEEAKQVYNPDREDLFAALDATPIERVKVVIVGQDPYPDHKLATGLAFSVPKSAEIPPTLSIIFDEYCNDLHYPRPKTGDLTSWAADGVLLWNAVPSCLAGHSQSHYWTEWEELTTEIINNVKLRGVAFAFLGSKARSYARLVRDEPDCKVLETVHPSPRALIRPSKFPFIGSRFFSTLNAFCVETGNDPVDWKLP